MNSVLYAVLTAAAFGAAGYDLWTSRKQSTSLQRVRSLAMLLGVLMLFWVSRDMRDVVLTVLVAFGALFVTAHLGDVHLAVIGTALVGLFTKLTLDRLPGGGSVVLSLLAVAFVISALIPLRRQMKRIARAERLVPGTNETRDVEVAGTVAAAGTSLVTPWEMHPCEAWQLRSGNRVLHSNRPVDLNTSEGRVRIEAVNADFQFVTRNVVIPKEQARAWARTIQLNMQIDDDLTQSWIVAGDPASVIGSPSWMPVDNDDMRGYRESPLMPVFSTVGSARTLLADQDTTTLLRNARTRLWSWIGWGLVLSTIASLQLVKIL